MGMEGKTEAERRRGEEREKERKIEGAGNGREEPD